MKVFFELAWFFKKEKKSYMIGIILLLFVALLQLIPPKIIGFVADDIGSNRLTWGKMGIWVFALIITSLLMYILRYYWRIYIFGSSVKLARILRSQLYEHFTKMPSSFYQRKRIGDLMAHATNDIQAIQQTAGSGVLTAVDSLATGGFVIITMAATISWQLTLISLLPLQEITDKEIVEAAKFVQAHDFIKDLPEQYLYPVNERGSTLSGGQRQLIAFARTIAMNPKILVLDEATANIDTETEELIQSSLEKMRKGRTTIAIAHRLSTIQETDLICVLHKGKIVERGNHQQLLAQKGLYYKMYLLQNGLSEKMEEAVHEGSSRSNQSFGI